MATKKTAATTTTKAAPAKKAAKKVSALVAAAKDINAVLELTDPIPETGTDEEIAEAIKVEDAEGDGFFEDDGLSEATVATLGTLGITLKTQEDVKAKKPAKTAKGKAAKAEKPAKAAKAKADKPTGPRVIASIVEIVQAKAVRKTGVTKEEILAELVKRFPDREEKAMKSTIGVQVPGRLIREKGLKLTTLESGAYKL